MLVTSVDPLRVVVSREGLARFCTVKYHAPSSKNLSVSYMHLTNYSLNKNNDAFVRSENIEEGSKRLAGF